MKSPTIRISDRVVSKVGFDFFEKRILLLFPNLVLIFFLNVRQSDRYHILVNFQIKSFKFKDMILIFSSSFEIELFYIILIFGSVLKLINQDDERCTYYSKCRFNLNHGYNRTVEIWKRSVIFKI